MPPRTNDFQELVSLIQRSLARDGDTVENSAMVSVQGMETKREIDILLKTSAGPVTIKVAVEAKDEGRPIDIETVEQLSAKYRGEGRVHVDKLVIVSRNGFTKGAREKAALLDVPLLTLDEAKQFDWTKLGPEYGLFARPGSMHYRMSPHFHAITIDPPVPAGILRRVVQEGRMMCPKSECGRDHGTLLQFVTCYTFHGRDLRMAAYLEQMQEKLKENAGGVEMTWEAEYPEGQFRVRFEGTDYPIRRIRATVHVVDTVVPVKCTAYEMSQQDGTKQVIPHLSADFGDWKMNFVMPEGLRSKRVTMQIRPNPKQRAAKRKKQRKAAKKDNRRQPPETS